MSVVLNLITKRNLEEWKRHCAQVQRSTAVNLNEPEKSQAARIKKALSDYNFFVKTYFPILVDSDCAAFHINAANHILKHNNQISVLEWPREHAKSMHADVFMLMWLLAHKKLTGVILMGKNDDDACNLLSDVQAQLQFNELFIHDFGDQYKYGDWETGDFTTKEGIRFLAIGRGKSPRGARKNEKRPNLAIIDDVDDDEIVNNQRRVRKVVQTIFGGLYFALSIKDWRIIVAGNRIHHQSILAHIVGDTKPNAPKRPGIYHSKVFAINPKTGQPSWPERYTLKQLNEKMEAAGTIMARREFFHENHVEGTIFKEEMFQWKSMPKKNWRQYEIIIGYCDPSFVNTPTSDFKAVRVWGLKGEERHCLKSFVQRTDILNVFRWMSEVEDNLPEGVMILWYIEKQFFNQTIADALQEHNEARARARMTALVVITDQRKKEDKYMRIVRMEPTYTLRKVYFNLDEQHSNDMIEGNNQVKGIEPGYKSPDDAPDADEGAWYYLEKHLPGRDFTPIIGKRTKTGW